MWGHVEDPTELIEAAAEGDLVFVAAELDRAGDDELAELDEVLEDLSGFAGADDETLRLLRDLVVVARLDLLERGEAVLS